MDTSPSRRARGRPAGGDGMISVPLETVPASDIDTQLTQPSRGTASPPRLLGGGGDQSLFRELARYVEQSGATLERTADEAATLQAPAHGGGDAVLTGVDREAGHQLAWVEGGLPRLPG